ncbi:hypothetical protein KFE25_004729 [Diacronema lutheri]|uniref:Sulfotransferase domain-containing protein n=2 Tax=Diacronema lutheri TaxID=2081491 RepID=A0A8J5XA88_DIALT|nr:hypothetical protein KFE25_004729 [Diacronema lutheri]
MLRILVSGMVAKTHAALNGTSLYDLRGASALQPLQIAEPAGRPLGRTTVCTADGRVLPSVLIIGVQKAGTTSLYSDMRGHLQGFTPATAVEAGAKSTLVKEVHYFDKAQRMARKGRDFYLAHYPPCDAAGTSDVYGVDATPNYLLEAHFVAEQMAAFFAAHIRSVRLLIVLRDPTERFASFFNHFVHTQLETGNGYSQASARARTPQIDEYARHSLERVRLCLGWKGITETSPRLYELCGNIAPALKGGLYAQQLVTFLRFFPPDQMMLTTSRSYVRDTTRAMADVADFLGTGLKPASRGARLDASRQNTATSRGVAEKQRLSPVLSAELDAFYAPHTLQLLALLKTPQVSGSMRSTPFHPVTAIDPADVGLHGPLAPLTRRGLQ